MNRQFLENKPIQYPLFFEDLAVRLPLRDYVYFKRSKILRDGRTVLSYCDTVCMAELYTPDFERAYTDEVI